MSSLFDDLDPDSSPLMKHLEKKSRSGEQMTEEDFIEPFPVFKRKMEREFDAITEQFKRLSIENPDEEICDENDEENQKSVIHESKDYHSIEEAKVNNSNPLSASLDQFKSSILAKSLSFLLLEIVNIL